MGTDPNASDFLGKFRSIREREEALHLPIPTFLALFVEKGKVRVAENTSPNDVVTIGIPAAEEAVNIISGHLRAREAAHQCKYVAATLLHTEDASALRAALWLRNDIVCFEQRLARVSVSDQDLVALAIKTSTRAKDALVPEIVLREGRQVVVPPLLDLPSYATSTDPPLWHDLTRLAETFGHTHLLFLSATPQGGGVALMRHALIRLYESLGIETRWCVMQEDRDAFLVTKTKFHNILQGVAPTSLPLTAADTRVYEAWVAENFRLMRSHIAWANVIIIDDPQPSGMIPLIRELNPSAKLLYRSHIQVVASLVDTPGTPQHDVWQYLWLYIRQCELFVSHPITNFVPDCVALHKRVYMPATTDPLDGLNKPLQSYEHRYYRTLFDTLLLESDQQPLDWDRPYVIQIARFDPSKGIPDVLDAYRLLRERLTRERVPLQRQPQLVIVGNGSIDDPDGVPIYNLTMETIGEPAYAAFARDIKVARLPHVDQLLGMLLWDCTVALQLSHREGFEVKVTEALMKGKPLVAYRIGGIPLQLPNGCSTLVEQAGDTEAVATVLHRLLTDAAFYEAESSRARTAYRHDALTVSNALRWLALAQYVITHDQPSAAGQAVVDTIREELGVQPFDTPVTLDTTAT